METKNGSNKVLYRHGTLENFCTRVFEKLGLSQNDAQITASALVAANLRGVDTHGGGCLFMQQSCVRGTPLVRC